MWKGKRFAKRKSYPKKGKTSYFRRYRTYSRRPKKPYIAKSAYKTAEFTKSSLSRKIVASKYSRWEKQAANNCWYVEEICPFKNSAPFWTKDGGCQSEKDIQCKRLYVRGGTWSITIKNIDNSDAVCEAWLGFVRDGSDYKTLAGDVTVPWSPYIAMENFGQSYKLSKWHKQFTLHRGPNKDEKDGGGSRTFQFKIGHFPIDVNKWISDKKGWPIVWITWRGNITWHVNMQFEVDFQLTFTELEGQQTMTRSDMASLTKQLEELKEAMAISGQAAMNTAMIS